MSHRGDSLTKKLATIAKAIKIAGENQTIWYCSLLEDMCKNIPYTQKIEVNKAVPITTVYQAVSRPRISLGASSTIDIGPVTLREPIPMPDIIRAVYKAGQPGERVAMSWPMIQIAEYKRNDQRRPMRSLIKKDNAAPTAYPM
jgi:hypothetical protein